MNTVVAEAAIAHAIYAHMHITFYHGKASTVQAWIDPDGSSRSRFPNFKKNATRRP